MNNNISFNEIMYSNVLNPDVLAKSQISRWNASGKKKKEHSKVFISQFRVKRMIVEVRELCEKIKIAEDHLRRNVDISFKDFNESLSMINVMKDKVTSIMEVLNDPAIAIEMKKIASKSSKKRARIRRNKIKYKNEKIEKQKKLDILLKEIDGKMNQKMIEDDKKRKDEESKKKADAVLKDVNKRKTEAKRFLQLIEHLKKLRKARENTMLGRGENVQNSEKQSFLTNIEKLKSLWEKALHNYIEEETKLKEFLEMANNDSSNNEERKNTVKDDSESIINHWNNIMFGCDEFWYQNNGCSSLDKFICVRKHWDQYVCSDDESTKIPVGWIIPPLSSEKWSKYIIKYECDV